MRDGFDRCAYCLTPLSPSEECMCDGAIIRGQTEEIAKLTTRNERLRNALQPFADAVHDSQEAGGTILNVKRFISNKDFYNAMRVLEQEKQNDQSTP